MNRNFELGIEFAKEMDQSDPLRAFRDRFYIEPGGIYMDGNSLGLCSKDAEASLFKMLDAWKKHAIDIWSVEDGRYFLYQDYLGKMLAPLINADPDEVTVMTNTTINIHTAIATFYKPTKERYKILVDDLNFPSDRYAVDGQVKLKGFSPETHVKVVKSADGRTLDEDAIIEAMTPDVAIALLPAVLYRSSQLLDMEKVSAAARERGVIIGWDLCHSIGSVHHDFKKIDPDFAAWCNYKYLSAGPGAIAGLFINKRHFHLEPGLPGWQGNKKETQFKMNHVLDHAHNAGGWQNGTQPLLSMAPLEGVLNIYGEARMERIREKSLNLTGYLMFLINARLTQYGYRIGNPIDDKKRGGHVALEHEKAYPICLALKAAKVIPDFRHPNVIRLAPVALYVSYEDVHKLVDTLEDIARNKTYEQHDKKHSMVV